MAKRPTKSKRRRVAVRPAEREAIGDRLTYRELRNTPGRVWERLSTDRPLTLVADGQPKALLIPIPDGDAAAAQEAYERGRALLAVRRIQEAARRGGASAMTLDQINRIIREVRDELRKRDATLG
jgi:hypothetical protein